MKAYEDITCKEMIDVIKEVFDVSNVQEKRREYVVPCSVWGFPLLVHVCKENPKCWRVDTAFGEQVDGFEWDAKVTAMSAINEELDFHYY